MRARAGSRALAEDLRSAVAEEKKRSVASGLDAPGSLQLIPHQAVPGRADFAALEAMGKRESLRERAAEQVVIMRIRPVPADALTVYGRGVSFG